MEPQQLIFAVLIFAPRTTTPAPQVNRCRAGEFRDDVAMDWHSCSLCFVNEGSMFRKQCEFCNCTAAVSHSTESRTTITTATDPASLAESTTMSLTTINSKTLSYTKAALITPTNNTTVIVGVVLVVVFLGAFIVIFWFWKTRNRQRLSTTEVPEVHVQGCFTSVAKKPIPCSEQDLNKPSIDEQSQGYGSSKEPDHVTGRSPTYPSRF